MLAYQGKLENLDRIPSGNTLILKPSLLGISKSFEIIKYANFHRLNTVISSTYDSSSAMIPYYFLAALSPTTFHGLDTLKFLPNDLSKDL